MGCMDNLSIGKRVTVAVEKLLAVAAKRFSKKSVDQVEAEGTSYGAVVEEYHWPILIHRRKSPN